MGQKNRPNMKIKRPLPVDVRRSKTSLLNLTICFCLRALHFFPAFRSSVFTVISLPGEGNLYNDLNGEAPPERSAFFRLQVCERVGKSVISIWQREKMSNRCILWQWKLKARKRSGFVIYSYFKVSALTVVKTDAKF